MKDEDKSLKKRRIITWALALTILAIACSSAYLFIRQSALQSELHEIKDSLEELKKQKDTAPEQRELPTETPSNQIEPQTQDTVDTNFTSLLPHGGFLSFDNLVTFEWTPHARASAYAIDIKHLGQEAYPPRVEQDRIVTASDEQIAAGKITHTLNLAPGDYEWRITALDPAQESLQSTEDRTYQVHNAQ